ncbi:MAG: UvrD-helicase domain-containing protein [Gammaproteobacteria bacterium]|nr:UvrD-helicase domain-containing protein [Gammaproteobacteria bacterium]
MNDDARLLRDDARARSDALDVHRSFVVQAPAGSGKTELLIQRYLRLLACVRNPEEVLAITFTRKAALEMQTRVTDALRDATKGVVADEQHRRQTIELAAAVLHRDEEFAWRLRESPRRMRIQTLDSFCAGLVKSLPISCGLGGSLATLADAEMHAMYRFAAAATLDWLLSEDDKSVAVTRLLKHLDNHTGVYIEHLARMLETRDQWLQLVGSGSQPDSQAIRGARRRLEQNIEVIIRSQLESLQKSLKPELSVALLPLLKYAAAYSAQHGSGSHPLTVFSGERPFPGVAVSDLAAWQAIAGMLLKQDGDWRRSVNKNDGFPPKDHGEKKAMLQLLQDLEGNDELRMRLQKVLLLPDGRYGDEQWEVLLALFSLLPIAVGELRRLFSERNATDHTEVALAANAALGDSDAPGDATLLLDYSIKHILIDEMQDTSIGQYQLIAKLIGGWIPGDGRTLFCVGDPMQSIYRFRNAEVGRFLQIREHGIGTLNPESLVLRRNFRSGSNLVHWFNTVFAQVLPLHDDIAEGAISYTESVPVESWQGQGECRVHALFGASSDAEADYGLSVIQQSLISAKEQTSAVLVRSRTQLPALLSRLRKAGVEYRAVEIDRLTDLPEIIDVLALTRAWCHEGDRLAWLALLRGPWVGLTWKNLHRLVRNDTKSTVWELMNDEHRLATLDTDSQQRLSGLRELYETYSIRRLSESLRDRIEVAWFGLGGPALLRGRDQLENVYRFFDLLEKIESAGTVVDVADLESRLDDERVSSAVENPYALQVMTMHKAKGLEFDHVMLYALGRSTRGRRQSVMSWMNMPDQEDEFEMLLSPIGPRAELENDPLHQYIEIAESNKERLELDRLLYVACTRARRSLHLVGTVPADKESFKGPPPNSLLGRMWPAVEQEYARAFSSGQNCYESAENQLAEFASPPFRRFRDRFKLPKPPDLPVRANLAASMDTGPGVEFYWVGLAARHAGTIVHMWLKQIATGLLSIDSATVARLRSANIRLATQLGVPEESQEAVCQRVEQALHRILSDPRGQWLISGEGHSELPLSGQWGDQIVSIVIDRIRIDDGIHWIVDYKTSTHEGGDLDRFLREESERYRYQLRKYATLYRRLVDEPVRTALYFPLLQRFEEVVLG